MATGEVKDFEITIAETAHKCEVKINGEPVRVYRCVITADIERVATTIELHCFGPRYEPIVIKGRMIAEEEPSNERRPGVQFDGSEIRHSCGEPVEEVTNFTSPNKQYLCRPCQDA